MAARLCRLGVDELADIDAAGQETGRAAVEVIPDTQGVTLAAISYPFGTIPHRDALQFAPRDWHVRARRQQPAW